MVKQDYQVALAQAAEREQRIKEKKALELEAQQMAQAKEKPPRAGGGWQVVAVQGIACAVILLLALFVRLGGGTVYDELRRGFSDGLRSNDLMAAFSRLWDGDPTDTLSSDPLEEDGDTPPEELRPNA
jgi:hypothetical protein